MCRVQIGATEVKVRVDSGAAVDILDSETFHVLKRIDPSLKIEKSSRAIYAYNSDSARLDLCQLKSAHILQ